MNASFKKQSNGVGNKTPKHPSTAFVLIAVLGTISMLGAILWMLAVEGVYLFAGIWVYGTAALMILLWKKFA